MCILAHCGTNGKNMIQNILMGKISSFSSSLKKKKKRGTDLCYIISESFITEELKSVSSQYSAACAKHTHTSRPSRRQRPHQKKPL